MAEKGVVIGLKDNNLAIIKMTRQEACANAGHALPAWRKRTCL